MYLLSKAGVIRVLSFNGFSFIMEEREDAGESFIDVIFKSKGEAHLYPVRRSVLSLFGVKKAAEIQEIGEDQSDNLIKAVALRIAFIQFIKDEEIVVPAGVKKIEKISLK